jgi:hypothetical protein
MTSLRFGIRLNAQSWANAMNSVRGELCIGEATEVHREVVNIDLSEVGFAPIGEAAPSS